MQVVLSSLTASMRISNLEQQLAEAKEKVKVMEAKYEKIRKLYDDMGPVYEQQRKIIIPALRQQIEELKAAERISYHTSSSQDGRVPRRSSPFSTRSSGSRGADDRS